jgi:hypothetical protein
MCAAFEGFLKARQQADRVVAFNLHPQDAEAVNHCFAAGHVPFDEHCRRTCGLTIAHGGPSMHNKSARSVGDVLVGVIRVIEAFQ